ncbi:MAG: fibronectin type III domain-containing protein [Marinobacter sp.]
MSTVLLAGCVGDDSGSGETHAGVDPGNGNDGIETFQTAHGSVSLSWVAPGYRINGEQLSSTDIQGYVVLYGRDAKELDRQARVDCKSPDCRYDVDGLGTGTWYFAVQTVDSSGLTSAPSTPVSRSL